MLKVIVICYTIGRKFIGIPKPFCPKVPEECCVDAYGEDFQGRFGDVYK